MKKIYWVLCLCAFLFANAAHAGCTATDVTADFGNVRISPNAAVGTEFGNAMVVVRFNCDANWLSDDINRRNDVVFQIQPTGSSTGIDYVYQSGLQGVGIRMREQSTNMFLVRPGQPSTSLATNSFCWRQMSGFNDEGCGKLPVTQCPLADTGGSCSITLSAQLVKTGPVSGGQFALTYANVAYYAPGRSNGRRLAGLSVRGNVAMFASCVARDLTVSLGRVSAARLNGGEGSTPVGFDFLLTGCEAGQAMDLTFATARQVGGQCDGLISNASSATARGVGIQIARDSGENLCWAQKLPYMVRGDGSVHLPMQASIRKLGDYVSPGTIAGQITVQANYK